MATSTIPTSRQREPGHPAVTCRASRHVDGFSRYQVRSAERDSWAGKVRDGRAQYFFDGLRFWGRRKRGDSRVLAPWQTPMRGWRHNLECTCELCRVRTRSVTRVAER